MADLASPEDSRPYRPAGGGLMALFYRSENLRGYSLLMPAFALMAAGIMVPFVILVAMSFWTQSGFDIDTGFHLDNFAKAAQQPVYRTLILRSMAISGFATLATVLLCYPVAYYVAFGVSRHKVLWLILLTLPFWTSYLLRVFAWKTVLGFNGVINSVLMYLGLIDAPLEFLLYSQTAVVITLTHAWAPFAILPIYVSLEKIDRSLLEAATDLGDGPWARFLRITLPLSMPGVIAAMLLIFIPTVGDYITPALLGGPDGVMIGNMIQMQFGRVNNWPMGAALALVMMVCVAVASLAILLLARLARRAAA